MSTEAVARRAPFRSGAALSLVQSVRGLVHHRNVQSPRSVFESKWSTLNEHGGPTWLPILESRNLAAFDIETDTTPLTPEEKAVFGEDAARGLDPRLGRITAISISTSGGETCRQAVEPDEEPEMLRWVDGEVKQLAGLGYVLSGWNSSGFDGPFVQHRALRSGVRTGIVMTGEMLEYELRSRWLRHPMNFHWWGATHVDLFWALLPMLRRNEGLPKRLKPLAREFGLDPVEVDASRMHELSPEQIAEYVTSDARMTRVIGEAFRRR